MRLKTWQLLFGFGLIAVITLFVTVSLAQQTADLKPCELPRTEFDAWQRFRTLPVKFTDAQQDTYYWKFEDKTGIHLGSFVITSNTKYFDEDLKEKDRLFFEANLLKVEWGVTYDSQCFHAYSAVKLKP
jgi:hypothetical protein